MEKINKSLILLHLIARARSKFLITVLCLALVCIGQGCKEAPFSEPPATPASGTDNIFNFDRVTAAADFGGARLTKLTQTDDSTYQVFINPENEPINSSPWYCFQMWATEPHQISLKFVYPEGYSHRYLPKYSYDGIDWQPFESSTYSMDSSSNTFILRLALDNRKLWIAAQENMNNEVIDQWTSQLSELDMVNEEEIGSSAEGRPLSLITMNEGQTKYTIVLIGRQHPPEVPGGTIALMAFVEELLADNTLANQFRAQYEILLFPLLNPDGVEHGNWRHNAAGQDLNRDWINFSQPETRAVRDWLISQERNYVFGIDFHTSFSGPYLLTLDTIPHVVAPTVTNAWINNIQAYSPDPLDIRPRAQTLPYCYNWFINELGMEAVTYEEGDEVDREVVRERARLYARTLMEELLAHFE